MRLKNFSLNFSAQFFKALSDEARIRLLYLIRENEQMCISDLELILEFTQAKTSRHLLYLKNSGILNARQVDQWVFYYIKDEVMDLVNQSLKFINKDNVLQRDLNNFRIMYSNRELALNKLHNKKYIN